MVIFFSYPILFRYVKLYLSSKLKLVKFFNQDSELGAWITEMQSWKSALNLTESQHLSNLFLKS